MIATRDESGVSGMLETEQQCTRSRESEIGSHWAMHRDRYGWNAENAFAAILAGNGHRFHWWRDVSRGRHPIPDSNRTWRWRGGDVTETFEAK